MSTTPGGLTENMIAVIEAFGADRPDSKSLDELWQALATAVTDFSPGGGGWPTVNGTGAGNLTAQTLMADTVGYNLTDLGTGGINLTEQGTGGIAVQTTGGGATTGIALTTQATDTGGIALTDSGGTGVTVVSAGDGDLSMRAQGAGAVVLANTGSGNVSISTQGGGATAGIQLTTQATDTAGIVLTNNSAAGTITLDAVAGLIKLLGVPGADPHVVGALFTTAGALQVSAG